MSGLWSRRNIISAIGAGSLAGISPEARSQAGSGLLARLRAAKKVRVGLANQPPYSAINPDGTLTGFAPTLARTIMGRLGVPDMEGAVATYGELIPGMQAGRWDFIAASLTITKARCEQVLYSDPILFDVGCFVVLKGAFADPPKLVADLIARKLMVGVTQGGAHARLALDAGIDTSHLLQFPSDVATMDGLLTNRIQVAFSSFSNLNVIVKQRKLDADMYYPVADDPIHGSACAFRPEDADLHAAFQRELRAIVASGEYASIAEPYGFSIPDAMKTTTAEQLCRG